MGESLPRASVGVFVIDGQQLEFNGEVTFEPTEAAEVVGPRALDGVTVSFKADPYVLWLLWRLAAWR